MSDFRKGLHDMLCRVGQADEQAFTVLFECVHRVAILTILSAFSDMDEAEAETVFNQAMFKVWQRASTYQGRAAAPDPDVTAWSWIRTTIMHTAQDTFRITRRRRLVEILENELIGDETGSESTDQSPLERLSPDQIAPTEHVADNPHKLLESRQGLEEFLQTLDERELTIIRLLAKGVPQVEIAVQVGVGTSRMSQIVNALRAKAEKFMRPDA